MAYGIPLPPVSFPYFYPSKLSASSLPSSIQSQSGHPQLRQNISDNKHSSNTGYKNHLTSPPLNFSKREIEIHQISRSPSVGPSTVSPSSLGPSSNSPSSPPVHRNGNKNDEHRSRRLNHIDDADCEMKEEENENVDIE